MRLFKRKRRPTPDKPKQERTVDLERTLSLLSARLMFLESLASHLVAELPSKQRNSMLKRLRRVVGGMNVLPAPDHVPRLKQEEFREELGRAVQKLIESASDLQPVTEEAPSEVEDVATSSEHSIAGPSSARSET